MATSLRPHVDHGGLEVLGPLLHREQRNRILLITGGGARHVESARAQLSGFVVEVFSGAQRHVPKDLVERASEVLRAFDADAVVSVGGGSATGLGKALRLEHSFFFVAVPTTYAGSELTDIYGITAAGGKQTGRDPRVVPDVALYDLALTLDMPIGLSVTSLMNALAHPLSALSTRTLTGPSFERALAAAHEVFLAVAGLTRDPRSREGRAAASRGTVLAGTVLRDSTLGIHHKLAHSLGGRFDLDHAGLHSVLLPHSAAALARETPDVYAALSGRLGTPDLAGALFDFLVEARVATSLEGLGLSAQGFQEFLAAQPTLPRDLLRSAFAGERPRT